MNKKDWIKKEFFLVYVNSSLTRYMFKRQRFRISNKQIEKQYIVDLRSKRVERKGMIT